MKRNAGSIPQGEAIGIDCKRILPFLPRRSKSADTADRRESPIIETTKQRLATAGRVSVTAFLTAATGCGVSTPSYHSTPSYQLSMSVRPDASVDEGVGASTAPWSEHTLRTWTSRRSPGDLRIGELTLRSNGSEVSLEIPSTGEDPPIRALVRSGAEPTTRIFEVVASTGSLAYVISDRYIALLIDGTQVAYASRDDSTALSRIAEEAFPRLRRISDQFPTAIRRTLDSLRTATDRLQQANAAAREVQRLGYPPTGGGFDTISCSAEIGLCITAVAACLLQAAAILALAPFPFNIIFSAINILFCAIFGYTCYVNRISSRPGPCCPVLCGDRCCAAGRVCVNPALGTCGSTNDVPCGLGTSCRQGDACHIRSDGTLNCCEAENSLCQAPDSTRSECCRASERCDRGRCCTPCGENGCCSRGESCNAQTGSCCAGEFCGSGGLCCPITGTCTNGPSTTDVSCCSTPASRCPGAPSGPNVASPGCCIDGTTCVTDGALVRCCPPGAVLCQGICSTQRTPCGQFGVCCPWPQTCQATVGGGSRCR